MGFFRSYNLNRTLCDVFAEMRTCDSVKNYSNLLSLIEEAQSMANRMEAALYDVGDLKKVREEVKELEIKRKKLLKKVGKNG